MHGRNDLAWRRCIRATVGAASNPDTVGTLDRNKMRDGLLGIGIVGTIIATICCFTPALVISLGALGLSAAIGYLDIILLPALAIFLTITGYALWRRKRAE